MSQSLIRLPEVQRRTGYSKAWIYRLTAEQRFPSSIRLVLEQSLSLKAKLMNGLVSALNRHAAKRTEIP